MNIMNLYVYENRSMSNDLSKPIMLENLNVDNVQIHIPKEIDGTDMGTWAWWFVYQNAKREKYSIPMTIEGVTNDEGEEEYISTVGLNHGFTGKHGSVMYAIEAVQADGSGAVTHEWHTRAYKLEIVHTLQGNQTEYSETESDIISALISRVNELITSGAEIAEIAATIEAAAETAQEVIDSIPADYSELSNRVGANTLALAEKADRSTTYTKNEVDQMIEDVEVETDTTLAVPGAPADSAETGRQIGLLKADLDDVENLTTKEVVQYDEIPISLTWTSGFMAKNGTVYSYSGFEYSNKISVSEGDILNFYRGSDGALISGNLRVVTCYSNGVVDSSKGLENTDTPYIVPFGVDEIIVTINDVYGNATGKNKQREVITVPVIGEEDIEKIYKITANNKPNRLIYKFDVIANGTYTGTDELQDMGAYRICFSTKISSITGIVKIGKGIGQDYGGGVGFDGTNLYQYFSTGAEPNRTQAHGLTLKDYVGITIDVAYDLKAKVTISTNGGKYAWDIPYWRSYQGVLSVSSPDALTSCELSYTCEGYTKDIWIFGDSYLDYSANSRWSYYLIRSGHTNYLLNGFPGRGSNTAIQALKKALSFGLVPRKIIWCMGMNDKDRTSAPSLAWLTAIEELCEICEENNIELILSIIPNVPSTNTDNTKKNAWVKTSGYRYIDFALAVSASGDSTWYDGMLCSDNVHPTEQGGIALYSCAVAEVPELLF